MQQFGLFLIIIFCASTREYVCVCGRVCVRTCACHISADKVYLEKESRQINFLAPGIKNELTPGSVLLSL